MTFEIGYNIVCPQTDTGVTLYLFGFCYCIHSVRNFILKKCFQILKQSESVYRIYC